MSAYPSLVLMEARVEIRSDPTSVCAPVASAETAAR